MTALTDQLQYNTEREHLIIPEYGRHLQKMINHAVAQESKEERNRLAKAIISIMGNMQPHLRDVPDFQHKLWDQLFIMSDLKLDADSPFEIPTEEMTSLTEEEKNQGFVSLFDGTNLDSWTGNTSGYLVEEGAVVVHPDKAGEGGGGNLYTKEEFADFIYRFDFQLTPGANNGIGVHAPLEGDAAYVGMEIQVLDNEADKYKGLQPYQYHGSVYGVIPAKRGFLKPTGEWNQEEIMVKGTQIKVTLNGTVITEGDYAAASKNGTIDHKEHPGLLRTTGHIAFLGHGEVLRFKNMRVKVLEEDKKGKKKKK